MQRYTRTFRNILVAAMLATGFSACYKDLELPGGKGTRKIALLGEFVAGDSLLLRAGQSIAITKSSALRLQLLNDLLITIQDTAGNNYMMTGKQDLFSPVLFTTPFTTNHTGISGNTYIVTAVHPVLGTATARVQIPAQINASVTDTLSTDSPWEGILQVKVRFNDPGTTKDFYVLEAVKQQMYVHSFFFYNGNWLPAANNRDLYEDLKAAGSLVERFDTTYKEELIRLPVYTTDARTENMGQKGPFTSSKRILLSDQTFNGSSYETTIQIAKNNFHMGSEQVKGRMILYLKSVSEDYFRFLKSYELSDPAAAYNSFEQPVKIEGNISNGTGVLGGVSQLRYDYFLDKWEF